MKILSARFISTFADINKCPAPDKPEYAFIGRSNVGKSSLINALVNIKKLAKVSGSPGKTRTINHFLIDESWYLVDLPGYGYARISKTEREKMEQFTSNYIAKRENLQCLFVLVDSRLEPQNSDVAVINRYGLMGIPIVIIQTKIDKISLAAIAKNKRQLEKALAESWECPPPFIATSAEKKQGLEQLMEVILEANKKFIKQKR